MDLDQIKQRILQGEEIEKIIGEIDWKEFEELVSKILKKHDFETHHNFRFKTNRRYEIDIVAVKKKILLAIDCKQWGRGRYKSTGLKYAIKDQKERVKQLKKFLKNNLIAKTKLKITRKIKFFPLIVTWFEEDLIKENDVFIIPIWKFNSFLIEFNSLI